MRILAATLVLLALPLGASARERQYAILSLVGDEMMIVQRELATGSRLDTNAHKSVSMPEPVIDRAVVLAIDDAVRRAEPGARTVLLASRKQALYDAAATTVAAGDMAPVLAAVRPIAAGSGATHLILVTKYRHRAMLRLRDGHVGSGFLAGVGFYVDHGSRARSYDVNDAERGFISPYTYLRVSLVDIASGEVIAEDRAIGSHAHTVANGTIGNAWNALSAQEKDRQLQALIREEAARVVPRVLALR